MPNRLETYDGALTAARGAAQVTLIRTEVSVEALKWASRAVGYLKSIEDDADKLRDTAATLETVAALLAKVGPIRVVMDPLKRLIAQIEERAEDVEAAAGRLESKFGPTKDRIDLAKRQLEAQAALLERAIDEVDSVSEGVSDAADASVLSSLPSFSAAAVQAAFDTILPAQVDPLLAAIDRMERLAEDLEDAVAPVIAPARAIVDIFNTVGGLVDNLEFLDGPLGIVADIIRPVQWALDAVSFVFDRVVNPVLNPILEKLGFNDLVDNIIDKLGLPSLNPFGAIETQLDTVLEALELDTGLFDGLKQWIDTYLARLGDDNGLLDVLVLQGTDGSELVVADDLPPDPDGDNPDAILLGLAGDDMLAGGLGDDTLQGGSGNDVLIGGRGNDELDGGDDPQGRDAAVILAQFSQMAFQYLEETDTLIATHITVPGDAVDQGTDTIRNVESVVFLDRAVDFADFGNIRYSGSTPSQPARLDGDDGGVPTRDFLFGDTGIDTINGFLLDDYIEGRGGFDSLSGGQGNDWIDGGPGRDFIDGGPGIDTAVYRLGDGATANFNRVDLLGDASRRPFTPDESPLGIENLTGGAAMDWFWGDDGANRLEGKENSDKLMGFGGNDTLLGGDGADQLRGGSGNDFVDEGQGGGVVIAGPGNDTITTQDGLTVMFYGAAFPAWSSPGIATGAEVTSFAGLPDLGYAAGDSASDLPIRVRIDLAAGTVTKYAENFRFVGTDQLDGIVRVTATDSGDAIHGGALAETVWGGAGDDIFTSEDALSETEVDVLNGGAGDDVFTPGRGLTQAFGDGGDDRFVVTDDNFGRIEGGAGIDTLDLSRSDRTWQVGLRTERAFGELTGNAADSDDSLLFFFGGIENVIGTARGDLLAGGEAANVLDGRAGNDTLQAFGTAAGAAGDTLLGGAGRDVLNGNLGNDLVRGGTESDLYYGGQFVNQRGGPMLRNTGGEDTVFGEDGNDVFVLGDGNDARYLIHGGDGVDEVDLSLWSGGYRVRTIGTYDPDALDTLADIDIILFDIEILRGSQIGENYFGPNFANTYIGEGGNDTLRGRGGDDVLYGNEGDDSLDGGTGNDLIYGGLGHNVLIGGDAVDTASWDPEMEGDRDTGADDWAPIRIEGTLDADLVRGTASFAHDGGTPYANVVQEIENIIGTTGADTIRGDAAANVLTGGEGPGPDILVGRGGNDTLTGSDGNDTLIGDFDGVSGAAMARINEGAVTGDYLRVTDFRMPTTGALTVEMLVQVQPDRFPNGTTDTIQTMLSYATPGNFNQLLLETNSAADGVFRLTANGTVWDTPILSSALTDGRLHRLSVTLEEATGFVEVYIDGALRAATTDPGLTGGMVAGGTLIFGQEQDALGGRFDARQILNGGVGDIRIFDTVRSQREVAEAWDRPLADPGAVPGLVANWRADPETGTMPDATGTGTALDLVGTVRLVGVGEAGADLLQGGLGDDLLDGGALDDEITAGAGADTAIGGNGRDLVFLNQGNDLFIDNAQGGAFGRDTVYGGLGDDTIQGGNGNDVFFAEWGNDLVNARLGDDAVYGGDGFDTVSAGAGNDTVFGGNGRDLVFLNQGDDLFGDNGQGGALGRDTVFGGLGNDTIQGGNGDDAFHGEGGADLIAARLGADAVYGGDGFDTIFAGAGNDTVFGGNGRDVVFLNQGDDLFVDNAQGGDLGRDSVLAGLGDDTIDGGAGNDTFLGEGGNDVIFARLGNDAVFGGDGFDSIYTDVGDDLVFGGNGRDRVFLGAGADRYVDTDQAGDPGRDTITGGPGADTFVFGTVMSQDIVTDFETGIDTLVLARGLSGGRSLAQTVTDAASVTPFGISLDFGGGNAVFLTDVVNINALIDSTEFL